MADNWKSPNFREKIVGKIVDMTVGFGAYGPNLHKNASDMEDHIFRNSSNKDEYFETVVKLFKHYEYRARKDKAEREEKKRQQQQQLHERKLHPSPAKKRTIKKELMKLIRLQQKYFIGQIKRAEEKHELEMGEKRTKMATNDDAESPPRIEVVEQDQNVQQEQL